MKKGGLEFNIRKLGKYIDTLASLSALALVIGIVVGAIMILTASGYMGGIFVMLGIFMLVTSFIYYWVSQYFVYMGEGMLTLLHRLLDDRRTQETKETKETKPTE